MSSVGHICSLSPLSLNLWTAPLRPSLSAERPHHRPAQSGMVRRCQCAAASGVREKPKTRSRWYDIGAYNVDPEDILGRAALAIHLLLSKPEVSLRLVRELRYEIRNDLSWNGGPLQRALIRATGGSTSMAVALGCSVAP
jgi:hypothetical protein